MTRVLMCQTCYAAPREPGSAKCFECRPGKPATPRPRPTPALADRLDDDW